MQELLEHSFPHSVIPTAPVFQAEGQLALSEAEGNLARIETPSTTRAKIQLPALL